MKKLMFIILFGLIVILPIKVEAAKVKSVSFGNIDTVKTGNTFTLPVYIEFSDIDNYSRNGFGIGGIVFNLEYEDDVFFFVKAEANGFDTYYDSEEKMVSSVIKKSDILEDTCVDNILYCGGYTVNLTFYVSDTEKKASSIKINDIVMMGYQLEDGVAESYDEDKILTNSSNMNRGQIFNIEKGINKNTIYRVQNRSLDKKIEEEIASVCIEKKKAIIDNKVVDKTKDSNNYLESIKIKGYLLDFYKKTFDYDLIVPYDVNNLEIEVELESKQATVEIVGADDLNRNNNKVLITVKASNGEKRTYTIEVIHEKEPVEEITTKTVTNGIKEFFNKYKIVVIIIGVLLVGGITALVVVNKISDKKLDDQVDKF